MKVALYNLGCKVNQYEVDAMQELIQNNGFEIVSFDGIADVYIVNTCTVTNVADRKSRQMLRRAKKHNSNAIVVATGCYTQISDNVIDEVDIVVGNNKKHEIVSILQAYIEKHRVNCFIPQSVEPQLIDCNTTHGVMSEKIECDATHGEMSKKTECDTTREMTSKKTNCQPTEVIMDKDNQGEYEALQVSHTSGHIRAYMKIQDGCNQFCSYCIIPFARGRVRSRDFESILKETEELAANGYKEVVLTGIHLSSYGVDIGSNLLEVIKAIHDVDGILRIRLGSLEPRIITEAFANELSQLPKVCPHFHLSLQSGCDRTLSMMNRRYTAEEYRNACDILRRYYDEPALTTDIIVGFPGETKADFEVSKKFVESIHFYETHIFKFSSREGTRAANMPDKVDAKEKDRRSKIMLELNEKQRAKYEEKLIGKTVEVLMEEALSFDGEAYQVGHTREYVKIGEKTGLNFENQMKNVEIRARSQIIH
jgi:threonylcarbamoyladenosine tRNA methylthiotransferase MtaB